MIQGLRQQRGPEFEWAVGICSVDGAMDNEVYECAEVSKGERLLFDDGPENKEGRLGTPGTAQEGLSRWVALKTDNFETT